MADVSVLSSAVTLPSASPQFLREVEVRRGIELLYFGYRDFTSGPDELLASEGLGRAHHRALYFIARRPGLIVSDLLQLLNITKQSLARVLNELQERGLVVSAKGTRDGRQRHLTLTESGQALEERAFEILKTEMQQAYAHAGAQAVSGFWQVMLGLLNPDERRFVIELVLSPSSR